MAFSTTSELAQYVEKELGHELSGASSQRTDIVSHLDRAHKVVIAGGGYLNYNENGKKLRNDVVFSFGRSQNPYVLTLRPAITTVTASIDRESTTLTMNAAPNGAGNVAGWFVRIANENEIYRISAHSDAASTATLDSGYVGSANVTSATCELFKLHYTLGSSDILRLISPFTAYDTDNTVNLVDKDELVTQYPLKHVGEQFPSLAAIVKETSGTLTLQMSSYPSDLERLEVEYVPIPTTLDTSGNNPIIPAQYRLTLAHMACYHMLLRNDDTRAREHLSIARDMFRELVEWNEKLTGVADSDYGRVVMESAGSPKRIGVLTDYED